MLLSLSMMSYGTEYHFGVFRSIAFAISFSPVLVSPMFAGSAGLGGSSALLPAFLCDRQSIGVMSVLF